MHEMALAQGILEIVEDVALQRNAGCVKAVWLELGALSSVEPDAIAFCFDAVTRGTVAEGAALNIDTIPGSAWCLACNESTPIARRDDPCPRCGGYQLQVADGTQMRVRELEIDA
jgi:hydrogenase nickel incorporation protein HypA/HybF